MFHRCFAGSSLFLLAIASPACRAEQSEPHETATRNATTDKRHVLDRALVVHPTGPDAPIGVLPKGTALRYRGSLSEGIDRYEVIVNVEKYPLPLKEPQLRELIDPLIVLSPDPANPPALTDEEVRGLLRTVRVDAAQLKRVLATYEE